MNKPKRFEVRADEVFFEKLDFIISKAAGITNRTQAVNFAIDIAVEMLQGRGEHETHVIHNRKYNISRKE